MFSWEPFNLIIPLFLKCLNRYKRHRLLHRLYLNCTVKGQGQVCYYDGSSQQACAVLYVLQSLSSIICYLGNVG